MPDGGFMTSQPFTFLHVGRFDAVKDHQTLLAAWALVQDKHPDARLVCIGRNTDSGDFAQLVLKLGVHQTVFGLGQSHDMPAQYAEADAFVLSSIAENSPLVIAEALACGLPVVSTDVGDAREVIGPCGRIVPPRSPADLASAMLDVATDPTYGQRARVIGVDRVKARFDANHFATAWGNILFTPSDAPTVSLASFAKRALQSFRALLREAVPPARAWLMALCAFGLSAVTTHVIAAAIPTYGPLAWVKTQVEWTGMILWAFGMWPILGHVYNAIIGGLVDKATTSVSALKL